MVRQLKLIPILIIILASELYLFNAFSPAKQLSEQARSFLQGRTDINKFTVDTVEFNGKYYWHQGPFPSLLFIPFIFLFGPFVNESLLQPFILALLYFLLFKLARVKGYGRESAFWLSFAFLFSSMVVGLVVNPDVWYFAQIVAMTLLTGLLLELETKRRFWLMGILIAMIVATRPTAATIAPLLILLLLDKFKNSFLKITGNLALFILPVLLSLGLLAWFNYTRFNDPFFNAYAHAETVEKLKEVRNNGVFNIQNIPSSFYYYFLSGFAPVTQGPLYLVYPYISYNQTGISFFIVAPFFIYAVGSLKKPSRIVKGYWVVTITTLLFLLSYFGMAGYVTFGPRFMADLLPILYLLILYALSQKEISLEQKIIICCSAMLNIYLLLSKLPIK